jgi:DNA ligase-1
MPDLLEGETYEMKGSAREPYKLKNVGGVYSCSCPAWRNQSQPIEKRTCKHLRKLRGDAAETARLGGSVTMKAAPTKEKVTNVPPALLLAEKWTPEVDPTGWWMSEKLDGVRAYWNGKEFISRLGNKFFAPEWLTKIMPSTQLDGELWMGRKMFQTTVSIVRRQDMPKEWNKIMYRVFDLPTSKDIFEERMKILYDMNVPWFHDRLPISVVNQERCTSAKHLKSELARLEKLGAEGVMLRQPGSLYEGNRSSTLLKVKSFFDDEATVIGHEPGAGRHKGRLGAVLLKWKGKTFKAGTGFSDKERENPPAVGSKVTFRYQELSTDGIPRFPVYAGPAVDK